MKIVGGAALIAGAVALDVFSVGAASALSVAIGDTAAAVLTSGTVALAIGGIGASMMLSGVADALHLNNTGQTAVGSQAPFRPWQIVYGRQRVNGDTIDMSLSDGGNGDNRWLWQVQILAAHAVESIGGTYLNQQQAFCRSGTNGLTGNLIGSSNTDNGNMDISGMCLDIHPTDLNFREYSNFYFDGNPRFWMAQYNGTQTQADPFYVANCSHLLDTVPHWDDTCIVQGMAYSLNRFWSNANWAAGMPSVRYDVTGKNNIYDPRTGLYGYSENAALVLADYMCNQQWGMLYTYADFDTDTWIAACNICDEQVTLTNSQIIFNTEYSTEARYAINGTLSTSTGGGEVTTQMLAAMAGRISYVGGKWYIFPGVYQGVSGPALTETDLLGTIDWKPTRKSRDLFNEIRATFTCPSGWDTTYAPGFDVYNTTAQTVENNFNGQWAMIDIPPMRFNTLRDYSSDPYLTQDNGVKYLRNTQYPYTISVATAQRLAKIELLRNRWQGTGTLKLPITYLGIMPNDILTITYPRFGWVNKQLEVQSTHIDVGTPGEDGEISAPTISLGVSEVDASQYTWLATDELQLQGGQGLSAASALIVQPPTNVVCTSGSTLAQSTAQAGVFVPGLNVTWTAPADASVVSGGKIYIQLAPLGGTEFSTVGVVDGNTTSFGIPGLNNNTEYQVQLFCANTLGIYSDPTTPVTVTVTTGVPAVPPALTGLAVTASLQTTASGIQVPLVNVTWTESTDPAVTANGFVQIWAQLSGGSNALIATVAGSTSAYTYTGASAGKSYAISLIAVDVWGNDSSATSQVSVTVPATGGVATGSTIATTIETASTALTNAATAQAAATAAQTTLAAITGTGILTPGQKASVIPDFNALIAAQSANDAQAGLVGVSHAAYDTALSNLTAYLATLTTPVAWSSLSNYTTINGTTFSSNFEAAYAAENALLTAIATAINTTATAAASAALLQNPNFAAGSTGWLPQEGWTIVAGVPCVPGSSYAAEWTNAPWGSGPGTSAISNAQNIACGEGTVLSASCWIEGATGATASFVVARINFYDAAGSAIVTYGGNNVTTAGTWQQSRCVATAPSGTAYAVIDCAVFDGIGTWFACGFAASILPSSLNDIPDGTTRFAAIETGADKTLNHILTTSWTGPTTGATIGTSPYTLVVFDVTSNGTSDVFNLQGQVGFTLAAGDGMEILCCPDSNATNDFGLGNATSQSNTYFQFCPFFGSTTGLAAGAHTLAIILYSEYAQVLADKSYFICQQISS